ncbi:MAG: LysR family transcriptional regulator [Steroidobacteraceae bacterium]|nr:LysR family transcriptional regulator [Steroidobacteraceae bacterium]
MEVSTRQLRAFRLVAQHRNFTRAAEAMFITPSGLSVLIRELENRVGFRLFDRTTRHVELTTHGAELLAVIQRSLDDLDAGIANIGRSAKKDSQSISLGVTPLVAANILPPAIREFRKQRPNLRIQLFDADLPTLMKMVETGKLDMSIGIFKGMVGVRREPFFRFSLMVARAASNGMPPRATTSWAALDGETVISLSPGHPHQQLIDKHLLQAGVRVQIGSVVNLLDTQIALVEAEEGIAIIPSFGLPACRNRKVVTSRLVNPVASFEFHLISNRGKELPPGAEEFAAFLKSYIATWAGRAGVL